MKQNNQVLTLSDDDPRVIAAYEAEKRLLGVYGLQATDYFIRLPRLGIKIRANEIGPGKPMFIVPGNAAN